MALRGLNVKEVDSGNMGGFYPLGKNRLGWVFAA